MSQETLQWLNQNVLLGQTDKRGTVWHYRASEQGDEPNHYPGFIPVADVERRLFGFEPVERPIAILKLGGNPLAKDTVQINDVWYTVVGDFDEEGEPAHKAITDDHDVILGLHGNDYQIHTYRQWLLQNIALILDDGLGITSAGLLRRRAQAWVEVSVPDNVDTPEGVVFRPNLLGFTSLDASLATTYKRTINEVVCDNTLHARIGEAGETYRIKHTSGSLGRIGEARQALNIIYKAADDFSAQVREFCSVEVTQRQWNLVLDELVPLKKEDGEVKVGRSLTIAEKKRDKLSELYKTDPRCAPWVRTKFGVVQTFNTYRTHHATIRNTFGGGRVERNLVNDITGRGDALDARVVEVVDLVVASS